MIEKAKNQCSLFSTRHTSFERNERDEGIDTIREEFEIDLFHADISMRKVLHSL